MRDPSFEFTDSVQDGVKADAQDDVAATVATSRNPDNMENIAETLDWDRYAPSEHEIKGGAGKLFSIWLAVLGMIGVFASATLYHEELIYDPFGSVKLGCDLNAVVKCSSSIGSWQAHLLGGLSNALVGIVMFSGLIALSLFLFLAVRLKPWMWWAFAAATLGAMGLVYWFIGQSIYFFGTLCPYCMITWTVVIALFVTIWMRQIKVTGWLYKILRPLVVLRWNIGVALWIVTFSFVVWGLWDQIVKLI